MDDTTGSSSTTTDYFIFAGQTLAIHDTAWHYLVADQLGSPVVQLKATGSPELVALKLPYGAGRYAAVTLGNLGFTGQRTDSTLNLTRSCVQPGGPRTIRDTAGPSALGD